MGFHAVLEVAKKVSEYRSMAEGDPSSIVKRFTPEKKGNKRDVSTKQKENEFNPDKRIDTKSEAKPDLKESFDPDKRIGKPEKAKYTDGEDGIRRYECRNQHLEGKNHEKTGVGFRRYKFELDGKKCEAVAPVFDSKFDAKIPKDQYLDSDKKQFDAANNQLKESINNNPELASKFTSEQLQQIRDVVTPDGYVWHHDIKPGRLQLVDFDVHEKTGHTGGRTIWGGGEEHR